MTLNDILCNFKQLKMQFMMVNGKKIALRGSPPGDLKVISNQKMQKILSNVLAQLSMITVTFVQQTCNLNLSLTELMLIQKNEGPPPELQVLLPSLLYQVPYLHT